MTDTILPKVARDDMPDDIGMAWDALNELTGDATATG